MDEEPQVITMTVEFDPRLQAVTVNGPLPNRMLCYGMLKLAEKALDEHYVRNIKPMITVPQNGRFGLR